MSRRLHLRKAKPVSAKPKQPKKIHIESAFKPQKFTPKNNNQEDAIRSINENQITILVGSAGVGKTLICSYSAIQALRKGYVDKIVISRPIVEAGEKIGFLPGSQEEKIHPYLIPIYDELRRFCSKEELLAWKAEGKIEIIPLGLMRGRNFHNCFIVLDEMQNATKEQLVMAITRFGMNSKMVIDGDFTQSDLPKYVQGGLEYITTRLENVEDIGIIRFNDADIIRNPIIGKILAKL